MFYMTGKEMYVNGDMKVHTYMPDGLDVNVATMEECEKVERLVCKSQKIDVFLIKCMMKKCGYDDIKKGDIVILSDASKYSKHVGVLDRIEVDAFTPIGAPLFRIYMTKAWSVGSMMATIDGDVPLISEDASYRFIPEMDDWYADDKVMTARHHLCKVNEGDDVLHEYQEAYKEFASYNGWL